MNFARWDIITNDFTKEAICHRNQQYKIIFIELKLKRYKYKQYNYKESVIHLFTIYSDHY